MAGNISAGEGALIAGANAVVDTRTTLDARTKAIRGTIEETRGTWDGAAARRFEELSRAWDEEVRKLNITLDTLEANLRKTDQDQARDEEDAVATSTKISSMMGPRAV